MAQKTHQLDQKAFSCAICLDLLKEPVIILCGHIYCSTCVQSHWDKEDQNEVYSCPQCRQGFTPRPVLVKNTMLAILVDELKKAGLQEEEKGCSGGSQSRTARKRQRGRQKVPTTERDVAVAVGRSADEGAQLSVDSYTRLIRLLEKRRTEVEQQIRSQQKTQEARVRELQDKLQQDISELKRTLAQLDSLSLTPDHK